MGNDPNSNASLMLIGGIFLIMYFFMIRPQTQRAKKQRQFIDELQKGDKVITMGGIHGKIAKADEHTVLLEIDNGTKVKIEKTSISLEMSQALQKSKETEA